MNARCKHIWTRAQDVELLTEYKSNPGFYAEKFGTTRNIVVCRMGWLKKRKGEPSKAYYSQEQEQFIIDNWDAMSNYQIAMALGKTVGGIKMKAFCLRKAGHDLRLKMGRNQTGPRPIGATHVGKNGDTIMKVAPGKWKYVGTIPGMRPKKEKKPKKERPVKPKMERIKTERVKKPKPPKKIITSAIRTQKKVVKQEKKLKLQSTETGGTWVRINSKTLVYRKAG